MITNKNFIQELKLKNPDAIDYILDSFGDLIYKIAYMNLNDITLSEECVNDVLFIVTESIDEYNYPDNKFKNWIASITQYSSLNIRHKLEEVSYESDGGESQ